MSETMVLLFFSDEGMCLAMMTVLSFVKDDGDFVYQFRPWFYLSVTVLSKMTVKDYEDLVSQCIPCFYLSERTVVISV